MLIINSKNILLFQLTFVIAIGMILSFVNENDLLSLESKNILENAPPKILVTGHGCDKTKAFEGPSRGKIQTGQRD